MEKLLKKFDEIHAESVAKIRAYCAEDSEIKEISRWLCETDDNPYSFLCGEWPQAYGSAEMFASLLHIIHHAVVDDGEITFVTVGGYPRIVFYNRHEKGFEDQALSEFEKTLDRCDFEVKTLDISHKEFPKVHAEILLRKQKEHEEFFRAWQEDDS